MDLLCLGDLEPQFAHYIMRIKNQSFTYYGNALLLKLFGLDSVASCNLICLILVTMNSSSN